MPLLDDVKQTLRISASTTAYDDEVGLLINAGLRDLEISGIQTDAIATDALLAQAVKFYCRAYFGDDDSRDRWRKAYEALKIALAMSSEYQEADSNV